MIMRSEATQITTKALELLRSNTLDLLRDTNISDKDRIRRFVHSLPDVSVRAVNCLLQEKFRDGTAIPQDIRTLVHLNNKELNQIPNMGTVTIKEVRPLFDYLKESIDFDKLTIKQSATEVKYSINANPDGSITVSQTLRIPEINDTTLLEYIIRENEDKDLRTSALRRLKEILRQ